MRKLAKLAMLVSVVGFAFPVASGIAGTGQPLPPIHPGPQGAQMVIKGVLSNYVAATAKLNGSVDVTITFPRIAGQRIQKPSPKLRVVLTPQTTIVGGIVNGRQGIVKVKRQSQSLQGARLVAIEVVTTGQATEDQAIPVGGTPVNPDPVDDGAPTCWIEECAAP
jgi:hypothetical protein